MRILVVHGSTLGGTAGLAEMIGTSLRSHDAEVEVWQAAQMPSPEGFDAVIIGGALYATRWHKDARRFVKRNTKALSNMPAYFFSSGPLDDTASTSDIPPVGQVVKLMDRVGARGHVTFGGRLEPDVKGFMASKVAEKASGDFRDPAHVDRWVDSVLTELEKELTTRTAG